MGDDIYISCLVEILNSRPLTQDQDTKRKFPHHLSTSGSEGEAVIQGRIDITIEQLQQQQSPAIKQEPVVEHFLAHPKKKARSRSSHCLDGVTVAQVLESIDDVVPIRASTDVEFFKQSEIYYNSVAQEVEEALRIAESYVKKRRRRACEEFDGDCNQQKKLKKSSSRSSNESEESPIEIDESRPFVCESPGCGATFTKRQTLSRHVNSLHLVWNCPVAGCGLQFLGKKELKSHLHQVHGEVNQENKPDQNTQNIIKQENDTHKSKKKWEYKGGKFVCDFPDCGASFKNSASLQIHTRTHTGEKPFLCTYPGCNKAFGQASHRNTHVRIHTGEKPYRCEQCNLDFMWHTQYTLHVRHMHGSQK